MLDKILNYLNDTLEIKPRVAVVLGSGLSKFADNLTDVARISYADIPGYPLPSIKGHVGEFAVGYIENTAVICARGRFHFYEGHAIEKVTLPIDVFHGLGCRQVLITNAAGCLREDWNLGDLMLIDHYLDFTFRTGAHDPERVRIPGDRLLDFAEREGTNHKLELRKGTYCWTTGPSYETPAEIHEIRRLGGTAVGMSTVPEIIKALELNLEVLGISCLTNYAAGITDQPLTHAEVLETTERVKSDFANLVMGILKQL